MAEDAGASVGVTIRADADRVLPDGIAIKGQKLRFVEIKAPRGKQRAAQAKFEAEIPAGWYVMLRTVDEALALR